MRRSSPFVLIALAIPLAVVPLFAHRLISGEVARGKRVGTAYLQAQAEAIAGRMQGVERPDVSQVTNVLPVIVGLVDADGRPVGPALPSDGRCEGLASLAPRFPRLSVRVMWPGETNPGRRRTARLHRVEAAVYVGSALLFLLAAVRLWRTHQRTRRELAEQVKCARDFSHRLKTPITSISLCAELAKSGRLTDERKRECAETIVAEASRLDAIVGEVLDHIEGGRHG